MSFLSLLPSRDSGARALPRRLATAVSAAALALSLTACATLPPAGKSASPMAAGSLADAWMTFRPGVAVYVDCGIAHPDLPDDVVSKLCQIAVGADWRQSLIQLQQVLRNGAPNGAVQSAFSADGPLSGPQASNAKEDDDDKVFVELSRSFVGRQYTTVVEVAPRITTKDGTSRAAVLISWKPN